MVIFILSLFTNVLLWIILLFEVIAIITSFYLLLIDTRNTASKMAWILSLYFIPVLGVILYWFLGRNPQTRKFKKEQSIAYDALHRHVRDLLAKSSHLENNPLANKIKNISGRSAIAGNQVTILTDGKKAYETLYQDLENAKNHIHLFFFIYKNDEVGQKIKEILIRKAQQGVTIRFAYDSLGSLKLPFSFIEELQKYGIETQAYDPVNSLFMSRRINWRNHRKIAVIDGVIGHTGGLNIGNEYLGETDKFTSWRDTNVRIMGPLVVELQEVFLYDWLFNPGQGHKVAHFIEESSRYFVMETAGEETGQIVYGGPYDKEHLIRESFLDFIDAAQESVRIEMPYFVPDDEALSVIRRAALSGVKVQIILPGKGDRSISFNGSNSFIHSLLTAGVEVYHYDNTAFIHCKLMIIDGKYGTIGSTNFDVRSFKLNHEISVYLYGPSTSVNHLTEDFERDLKNSIQVTESAYMKKNYFKQLKETISALFAPLL